MIVTGRLDRASRRSVMTYAGNVPLHKNGIIASPEGDRPSSTAYLVEQDSQVVVRSHFHVDTGHGPITAGEEGLAYLTLRPLTVPGGDAQYLPDSRDKLE